MTFNKPCIDCGRLSRTSRCENCTTIRNREKENNRNTPQRKAHKAAMYGWRYQQLRKQIVATAIECHICRKPFTPTDRIEADHLIPSDPYSPLAAAHRRCNQSRGNKTLE